MNNVNLYDVTANIDENILAESIDKPVKKIRKPQWTKWVAVAACFVIAITAVFGFNRAKTNGTDGSTAVFPVLKAYAMDSDNKLQEYEMPQNKGIKLPEIELGEGFNGFLFAVDKGKNEPSDVQYLSITDFASKHEIPGFPHDKINEIIEPYGKDYFYYMPDANEKDGDMISFSCYMTKEGEDVTTEYSLLIFRDNGEYTITLNGIKSFPAYDSSLPVTKEN